MSKGKSLSAHTFDSAAKPKSSIVGASGGVVEATQASVYSKDVVGHQQINIQMFQNVLLIWLDNNIDSNSDDCRNSITQLQRVVNSVNAFTDGNQCIEFIDSIGDEKACMIISGSLGQHMMPRVHDMCQVDSIFIFCGNAESYQQWAKEWPKIKGVFTEISPICEALKQAAHQCEQNAISISFMAASADNSKKNLDQLDCSFMYTQILKEILLTIEFEPRHFTDFIEYCRDVLYDNEGELQNVKKLEREYRDQTPIWWYTYDCFLYSMLNRALRIMDVEIIIKLGFFIDDLHRHIEQLHSTQFSDQNFGESFTVYRGQGMLKAEFDQMSKTKGGLIAFNNFLSTSKNRKVSLKFANHAVTNPNLVSVLFVMTIDSAKSTTPFASIGDVSFYKEEEGEVLFAMHTIFRINDVKLMDENQRFFQVELTLTSDNDKDLHRLTERIRDETEGSTGWLQLGELLLRMGQVEKARQVYEILLEQTIEEGEKASIHRLIGRTKCAQGKYEEAITFCINALEIEQKILPPNHPDFVTSYNYIGNMYDEMGEYSKALSYYEKALEIDQKTLPPTHPDLASSYNNIGVVYSNMGEYSKALASQKKALEISQKSLPPNHLDLASYYNNIGLVYSNTGKYSKALSFHEKALAIKQQSLPLNHPDLASSYNNMGVVYSSISEYPKALLYYGKAFEIQQQSLPPNHPKLARSYISHGIVYRQMGEYPQAIAFYKKALEIQKQSLSLYHPDLASSYSNIGGVYDSIGEYPKALAYYEKALEIQQQSLPPNHPNLAKSYITYGIVYDQMEEYSKAIAFYEKALEIQKQSLHPNHPDLAMSYNNMGLVYENIGDCSKACSFYERAMNIGQQSLSTNHPDLQGYRRNFDRVKKKL